MRADADPDKAGMRIEARAFLAIGGFLVVLFLVYLLASYESAGTVLLLVGAAAGILLGLYFERQARLRTDPADEAAGAQEAYLPHASIWPFGLGVGALLMANGLALGLWAVLPGAALTLGSAWGFARQSKHRD
jgi:hypothetical protein